MGNFQFVCIDPQRPPSWPIEVAPAGSFTAPICLEADEK